MPLCHGARLASGRPVGATVRPTMSDTLGFDFDFAVQAPFRMQPGLRRLAPGTPQLTPAALPHRGVSRHLREKLAVLWAFADDALCAVPGFDARPALDALAAHAAAEHPSAWQVDGARWRCAGLGWSLDGGGGGPGRGDAASRSASCSACASRRGRPSPGPAGGACAVASSAC